MNRLTKTLIVFSEEATGDIESWLKKKSLPIPVTSHFKVIIPKNDKIREQVSFVEKSSLFGLDPNCEDLFCNKLVLYGSFNKYDLDTLNRKIYFLDK